MKTTFLKAFIVIAITTMAFTACAQGHNRKKGHRPSPEKVFKHLDSDEDGVINKDEAKEAPRGKLYEHFDAIDADSSGTLTVEELETYMKNRMHKKE